MADLQKCRACGGPLYVFHLIATDAAASTIRLTVRTPQKKRFGEFVLCPRCVARVLTGENTGDVQASLLTELRALLR